MPAQSLTHQRHNSSQRSALRASVLIIVLAAVTALSPAASAQKKASQARPEAQELLWKEPGDIRSRDLFFGPGGKQHAPHGSMTYLKEDLNGHTPKFDAEDATGQKWRVKNGGGAEPA